MQSSQNKIIIYGILPPPFGGVSIHLLRFKKYLENFGANFVFVHSNNPNQKHAFIKLFFSQLNFKKNIIHLHGFLQGKKLLFLLFLMFFCRKKVIVTIHNDRFLLNYNSLKNIQKIIAKFFYSNISHIISVNPDSNYGFITANKISVIPAFIPPTPDETDIKQLPKIFHQIRKKHKFLITANAFRISFYNNQDLYGIDLSIELMRRLVNKGYKDVGFIYVIPDIGDYDYYEKMKRQVEENNLQEYFHFYTKSIAYPAAINMCDLFIRPTNTDGYGVSIAEAIFLQKPAIASDVCKRPEGTVLFENRNIDDLFSKTIDIIDNYEKHKEKIENIEFEDNAEKILEVYKKLLIKNKRT